MAAVIFLSNSAVQLPSLPREVRVAFEWAIRELARDPTRRPRDSRRGVDTKALVGPLLLFRIAVRPKGDDPGYRGIYAVEDAQVLFVRFARRDSSTYRGLRRLARLLG